MAVDKIKLKKIGTTDGYLYPTTGLDSLVVSSTDDTPANIEENAQENKIETVKVAGTALTITSKAVDIEKATLSTATDPKFGVVQVGTNVKVADGVISVDNGDTTKVGVVQLTSETSGVTEDETKAITPKGAKVTITEEATAETGYAKTYTLKQAGVELGKINIPLDYLVKKAEIKTCTTDDDPIAGLKVGDKYIDFTVNVKSGTATDEHMYIAIKDMGNVYTAGDGIALSSDNKFSVNLATDSGLTVDTNGLKTNKVTAWSATVADTNLPSEKLVKDSLDLKQDKITAGAGLEFDSTSTTTLKHSNSVTEQTTQSLNSLAFDAQGHITGATVKTLGRGLSDNTNEIGHSNSVTAETTGKIGFTKYDEYGHITSIDKGIELGTGNANKVLKINSTGDELIWDTIVGNVADVQIDGTTIVDASHNANIPVASSSTLGVVKVDGTVVKVTSNVLEVADFVAGTAGEKGLVPKPSASEQDCVLSASSGWIPGITYEPA